MQKSNDLSIRAQCKLLSVNRSGLYYMAKPVVDIDLEGKILNIWFDHNTKGWRSIQKDLHEYEHIRVNHKKLRRIMHKLGIRGILPKSNTSKSNKSHYKYPYGLNNLVIDKSNMVWCSDITYIKIGSSHVYLVAIVDVYSRAILDYEISNTLDAEFCIRCLNRCIETYGIPKVFNTDQGVQYTSDSWIAVLNQHNMMISMDGKGRWADNIWIERIWRTIKYECVHLLGIESLSELKQELKKYIDYYNHKRLHSSLNYKQPMVVYLTNININKNDEYLIYCELSKYQEMQAVA